MLKYIVTCLALLVGTALPAHAGGINILASPYQTGVGGEFTYHPTSGWLDVSGYAAATRDITAAGSFQTFCLETNEYINIPDPNYEAVLNTAAVNGGSGGPNPDPLSKGTGWLYSQFALGTLAGYNYGPSGLDRKPSADFLQKAIWWLEEEKGFSYNASNPFMYAVFVHFGGEAAARADGASQYGVYALNMTKNGVNKQDALFFSVPDGGATLILLGGAMLTLGAFRRRFGA